MSTVLVWIDQQICFQVIGVQPELTEFADEASN